MVAGGATWEVGGGWAERGGGSRRVVCFLGGGAGAGGGWGDGTVAAVVARGGRREVRVGGRVVRVCVRFLSVWCVPLFFVCCSVLFDCSLPVGFVVPVLFVLRFVLFGVCSSPLIVIMCFSILLFSLVLLFVFELLYRCCCYSMLFVFCFLGL